MIILDYLWAIWLGVFVIALIIEGMSSELVSVWFVLGALCAAVATIFTDSVLIQLVIFVSVSLVTLIATRPLVKKLRVNHTKLITNADSVIGQTGVMLDDLLDLQSVGQAKVGGKVWSVKTDMLPLKKGDTVRVLAIEGVKLMVRKVQ